MSSLHLSTARITFGLKIHPAPRIRKIIFDLLNRDTDWIRKNDTNKLPNQIEWSTFKFKNFKERVIEGLLFALLKDDQEFLCYPLNFRRMQADRGKRSQRDLLHSCESDKQVFFYHS